MCIPKTGLITALLSASLVLLQASPGHAAAISLNFASDVGGPGPVAVGANTAGVVPVGNWNDIPLAAQSSRALIDSSGATVSGLTLTTEAFGYTGSAYNSENAGPVNQFASPGDNAMMRGHIYHPAPTPVYVTFNGTIPYSLFDVYVYYHGGIIAQTTTYSILDDSGGSLGLSQVAQEVTGGYVWTSFVQSDGVGGNNANYVKFSNLTSGIGNGKVPTNFRIQCSGGTSPQSYPLINGLQIVDVSANRWNGGGDTALWTNLGNWTGGVPADGTDLIFGPLTGTQAAPVNNLPNNDRTFTSLQFTGDHYEVSEDTDGPHGIKLSGPISNSSNYDQEFTVPITLTTGAGAVHTPAHNLTLGAISGAGMALTKTGVGSLTLTGTSTLGAFNHNAGTSIIGASTTVATTTANAGTLNFNSAEANGTLALPAGSTATVNIGLGAKVATADFLFGAGTVQADIATTPSTNPLTITSTLKLAGASATIDASHTFTATGANLANTTVPSTLTLSGGTLALAADNSGTGGNISYSGGNVIHTFLSSGSLNVPCSVEAASVLVVGGGGGGGGHVGGGGGAGGLIYYGPETPASGPSLAISAGSTTVTVGAGGAGGAGTVPGVAGANGGDSMFGSLTAVGGGGGGGLSVATPPSTNAYGLPGGSGGGTGVSVSATFEGGGSGTAGQGNAGGGSAHVYAPDNGSGGGGGGAGGPGTSATTPPTITQANGGPGLQFTISGTPTYYAGGGGGGTWQYAPGIGGSGGGGSGATSFGVAGTAGAANTGGGGGGGAGGGGPGGAGGSGIVIVSYPQVFGVSSVNLPHTNIAATASSTLDLGYEAGDHTLGGFILSGGTLTVTNGNSLTLAGTGISATGTSGSIAIAATMPIKAGTVDVATDVTLSLSSPLQDIAGGLTKIGGGSLIVPAGSVFGTFKASAGTVNFNSTQANGTLALPSGSTATVNIGPSVKVATADLLAGAGTVQATNPLTITSTLKLAGGTTATLTDGVSFTATGANLANTNVPSTLTLSGGTLAFSRADNTGTGGDITISGGNVIHTFLSSGTLDIPRPVAASVLVVGGGGGGGWECGGGGGAGGLIYYGPETPAGGHPYGTSLAISAGSTTVTVGAGGAGDRTVAKNGGDSVFGTLTAVGGGGGGHHDDQWTGAGSSGGSGGGGTYDDPNIVGQQAPGGSASAVSPPQGCAGGYGWILSSWGPGTGGGGGGAGGVGLDGTADQNVAASGGNGLEYAISGTPTYYAGGGGGGTWQYVPGAGGLGGGGGGGGSREPTTGPGAAGAANTGGGGGGGSGGGGIGGDGGSGIVIVSYPYQLPPSLNLPKTNIAVTASSMLDLGSPAEAVTLGGLSLSGSSTELVLTGAARLNLGGLTGNSGSQLLCDTVALKVASGNDAGHITAASLTKVDDGSPSGGTLTLRGSNNIAGGVTVEKGTLEIGNVGALLPGRSLTIAAGGTVVLSSGLSAAGAAAHGATAPVPEPGALALLAAGFAGLLVAARRRSK